MEKAPHQFHVLSADAFGSGKSPAWQGGPLRLRDEVALLAPVFGKTSGRFAIVGHSYGAATALIAATMMPERIRALAVYEPTLFSLLDAEREPPNDADGIRFAVAEATAALRRGATDLAAQRFIDFWMHEGAWAAMPEARRQPILASIENLPHWGDALFNEPTPLEVFAQLDIPVLYMMGKLSPASSRGVGRLLTAVLPQVEIIEFEGLGHMGPVTHPQIVNDAIFRFLDAHLNEAV